MLRCDQQDIFDPYTYNLEIEQVTYYHDFLANAEGYSLTENTYTNTYGEQPIATIVVEEVES